MSVKLIDKPSETAFQSGKEAGEMKMYYIFLVKRWPRCADGWICPVTVSLYLSHVCHNRWHIKAFHSHRWSVATQWGCQCFKGCKHVCLASFHFCGCRDEKLIRWIFMADVDADDAVKEEVQPETWLKLKYLWLVILLVVIIFSLESYCRYSC